MMRRPRRDRGMTLLEILLSLLVLVLGVMGVLALFPPGIQSATESMEDTNAAVIAESVAHALTNSMRFAVQDPNTKAWRVVFTHDLGAKNTVKVKYEFELPLLADPSATDGGWKHYPSTSSPPQPDQGGALPANMDYDAVDTYFTLAGDPWLKETTDNVKDINDRTDTYSQFGFSLDIRKVNTLEHLISPQPQNNPSTQQPWTKDDLEPLTRLYEVRINIFRVFGEASMFGGGGGTTTGSTVSENRRLVAQLTKRISL